MFLEDKSKGDLIFLVTAAGRKEAKNKVSTYIDDHPDIELDHDETYMLFCERATAKKINHPKTKPDIKITDP